MSDHSGANQNEIWRHHSRYRANDMAVPVLPAQQRTPVVEAMRRWMNGERIPSIADQFAMFGSQYRNHIAEMFDSLRNGRERVYASLDLTTQMMRERDLFVAEFGFAVPSSESIELLLAHSPILEIGAGSGSWAKLLRDRGADVIATDPILEQYPFRHARYSVILPLQGKTAVRRWHDRTVFCAWPSLNGTWLRQAARAMRPGRKLFVVHEDACAEDSTWDYISSAFRPIANHELLGWNHMHDRFEGWVKLGSRGA